MKTRLLPYALALLLGCAAPILASAQEHKREHKEPETELGETMDRMNGAWRKLKKQVADPASNASSLVLVATVKVAAEKALTFTPARAADVPAADRAKFTADYQAQMKAFIAEVTKLGAALMANDNAAAAALVQKIGGLQKEGHKEFKRPDM